MNTKPIDTARDTDLRQSVPAMHRAALRARELALQTGTAIVVSREGVLQTLDPADASAASVQEARAPYPGTP